MVSKLSTLSLALAVAGALGQTCAYQDLTANGLKVGQIIEDYLLNSNSDLQSDLTAFENNSPWASITTLAADAVAVATDLGQIAQNFTFYQGEFNYCDYFLLSEVFEQAIPTLISNLQGLSSEYNVFQSDNDLSLFGNSLQTIADNSLVVMNTVYSALPGCQNANQIVGAFNGLPAAVASYQQALGLPSTIAPPIDPTPCPTSPTSAPTTTPTAPPTTTPASAPTTTPTAPPSTIPTSAPTTTPTAPPSTIPTSAPTTTPTAPPSTIPTSAPTTTPASAPTTTPASAPQCTSIADFSEGGLAVVYSFGNLNNHNSDLQTNIIGFEEQNPDYSITSIATEVANVANDLAQVAQNITFYQSGFNYCDYLELTDMIQVVVAPTLLSNLQSLSSEYNVFQSDNDLSLFGNSFQTIADNILLLMTAVYSSQPECQNAGQATEAFNGIPAAVASFQQAFGLASGIPLPAAPTPCPTSTAGGSTATAPPSTIPASAPTTTPTAPPSTIPTSAPTTTPTDPPSTVPTVPTTTPASAPTTTPESAPTTTPASAPTTTPTSPPTCKKQRGQVKRAIYNVI